MVLELGGRIIVAGRADLVHAATAGSMRVDHRARVRSFQGHAAGPLDGPSSRKMLPTSVLCFDLAVEASWPGASLGKLMLSLHVLIGPSRSAASFGSLGRT